MVSLWLLIIICSLVINQLHLCRWGRAAKAMPWYEWLPRNVTPALLAVQQLWWQREHQVNPPPRIVSHSHRSFLISCRQIEMKIKSTGTLQVARSKPSQMHKLYSHASTQSFPSHELVPDDRAQCHMNHHLPRLVDAWNELVPACAWLHKYICLFGNVLYSNVRFK